MNSADTRRLITGEGVFLDDLQPDGVLHARFVRSPHAHARLINIDLTATAAMPGVVAVVTAAHLGLENAPLPVRFPHPGFPHAQIPRPLADGLVRHVGEPVAVVVAHHSAAAADAVDAVRVEYEPLPAVASLEAAKATGAPAVHDIAHDNLAGSYRWVIGDPDAAFRDAPVTVAARLAINRGAANPIETRGCCASWDHASARLTVWASTQSPHYLRRVVARMSGLPETDVRVITPEVGGAFGVKGGAPREYIVVALLARRLGRPVKWVEDRREHFVACQHDREQIHHVEVAATREGCLLAVRDRFWIEAGAYALYGHLIAQHTVDHLIGPYRLPALDVHLESIYTHCVPTGAYRGAGRPQGAFVIERAIDHLARALDLDPVEIRRRNLIPAEALPYDTGLRHPGGAGVVYDSGDYPALLALAVDRFDYAGWRTEQQRRPAGGPRLGLGVALYVEETATHGHETITLRMDDQGHLELIAGPPSQGQGVAPVVGRLVERELALPEGRLLFTTGDTAWMPESSGTHGSRSATMIGNAAVLAARDLALQIRVIAAVTLGCDVADVTLEDGRARRNGVADRGLAYSDLVGRESLDDRGPGLEATAVFVPGGIPWSHGAHLVAIELDDETGEVRILRYLVVHDSGAVLDAGAVGRQILGAVVQAISGTLSERIPFDDTGQPLVTTLTDFGMMRAARVPPIEIIRLETPSPHNPLGLKGAGESGCMPVYAALAAAIDDALAGRSEPIRSVPLSAYEIWAMVHSNQLEDE
jgi:carbon-monoxide dehydrogenase large subunit